MRIMILGAKGALGRALNEGSRDCQLFPMTKIGCDITKYHQVRNLLADRRPDIVINCAAYTNVNDAEIMRGVAWDVNAQGAKNVATACVFVGAWLIHISTDYVFGGSEPAYHESSEPQPIQNYGRSKLAGELAVQMAMNTVENDAWTIVRTSTLYGPPRRPSFVRTIVENAVRSNRIDVVDDQVSKPTSTDLLAEIIRDHVIAGELNGIVHATSTGVASKYQFAKKIVQVFDLDCEVQPKEYDHTEKPRRPRRSVLGSKTLSKRAAEIPNWFNDLQIHASNHFRAWMEFIEQCKSERP